MLLLWSIVYPRGGRYQKFTMIESTVPLKIPQPTFEWDERVELPNRQWMYQAILHTLD